MSAQLRWGWIGPAAVMGVGIAILQLLLPAFSLQIFDRVPASGSMETLAALLAAAVIAILGAAGLEAVRARWIAMAAGGEAADLGDQAITAATNDIRRDGAAMSRVEQDAHMLGEYYAGSSPGKVIDGPLVALPLLALFVLHPGAGLAAFAACAACAGLSYWAGGQKEPTKDEPILGDRYAIDRANGDAPAIDDSRRMARGAALWNALCGGASAETIAAGDRSIRGMVQVGLISLGAGLAAFGEMSGGEAIAMSILGMRSVGSAAGAASGFRSWRAARNARQRLQAVVETSSPPTPALTRGTTPERLRLDSLRLVAEGRLVLADLQLSAPAGGITAVTGDNGAGKSALLALCAGAAPATAGLVRIDGRPVEVAQYAGWIGYVDQAAGLSGPGSVRQELRMLPDDGLRLAALERFGLAGAIGALPAGLDAPISALSAGERTLLRIARAFSAPRRLFLLDEPEIWLNAPEIDQLRDACAEAIDLGAAILWATKRPSTIQEAHAAFILNGGRLKAVPTRNAPPKPSLPTADESWDAPAAIAAE